jgi:hypothetical protein
MNDEFEISSIIWAIEQLQQFRDDCAIRALGSLIKESDLPKDQQEIDRQAKKAYRYADAMLKAKFN